MTPIWLLKWYKADKKYDEIHALFLRDEYKEAEEMALDLLKGKEDHVKTILLVAQIAWNEDHYQKAREWYNKALHYDQFSKEGLLWRAKSSYQLYNFEDALNDYLTLYEKSFKTTDYLIALWDTYQKINLQKIALRYYKKAVKSSPWSIPAHLGLWYQYIILGAYHRAKDCITKAKEMYYAHKKEFDEVVLKNIEWLEEQLIQLTGAKEKKSPKKK